MSLIFWNGVLLFRNGSLAKDLACCCGEVDGCCGRLQPGPTSLEGAGYYPLVLHARITAISCPALSSPIEFDLTWNPSMLAWENTGISFGDGAYSVTYMRIVCSEPTWQAELGGGICQCGTSIGSCAFDMTPTLTDGECNPVDLDGTALMSGLNCCGNLMGGSSVSVEVWE